MLTIITTHPIQYQVPIWRELARRGNIPLEVIFLCDHGGRESFDAEFGKQFKWDFDLFEGYESHVVNHGKSPGGFMSLHIAPALWAHCRRRKTRVIWIQGWQVAGYWESAALAKALGCALWLRGESNPRSGAARRRWTKRFALDALFRLVTRFLTIGAANRAFYLARGAEEAKLAPAPYCVDNAKFRRSAQSFAADREKLRSDWAIPANAFCYLFVGKLIGKKRPLDILEAAETLLKAHPEKRIHIAYVGSGELEAQLRARANVVFDASGDRIERARRRQIDVSLLGFMNQAEIGKAYCAADCLILPSEADETWGLVVNEAMASGLPAIISNACGCADDLALPGRSDLIFPVGDVAALAQSMEAAARNPPKPEEIARKIDAYDMLRTVETVERLYRDEFA